MTGTPSPNGDNGVVEVRDGRGRFLPGNPGGPGNPMGRNVAVWRAALAGAVSADDVVAVTEKLLAAAKAGEPWAVRELLDRLLGKPNVQINASVSVPGREEADADADARARERCERFLKASGCREAEG